MKKYTFCIILLLTLPASATITYIQSNAQWSGGTGSCVVGLTTTTPGDLLVVWSEWQTPTGTPNAVTATTAGSNSYASAVGPTVQPAATNPTAAQIFYAKKIVSSSESVTVTFSGAVSSSACVLVEYSGADIYYPLDSVSAGYSTSGNPTILFDSGTVAPANSNLLVFGAGVADVNIAMLQGSGFTKHQFANGTWGTGLVEDNSTAISGNNVLQRATAGLSGTTAGHWVMQMAVFRDASSTVGGGWNPPRFAQILDASQFPGIDIGDQINNALTRSWPRSIRRSYNDGLA